MDEDTRKVLLRLTERHVGYQRGDRKCKDCGHLDTDHQEQCTFPANRKEFASVELCKCLGFRIPD